MKKKVSLDSVSPHKKRERNIFLKHKKHVL
jgi:hypothetical protein